MSFCLGDPRSRCLGGCGYCDTDAPSGLKLLKPPHPPVPWGAMLDGSTSSLCLGMFRRFKRCQWRLGVLILAKTVRPPVCTAGVPPSPSMFPQRAKPPSAMVFVDLPPHNIPGSPFLLRPTFSYNMQGLGAHQFNELSSLQGIGNCPVAHLCKL